MHNSFHLINFIWCSKRSFLCWWCAGVCVFYFCHFFSSILSQNLFFTYFHTLSTRRCFSSFFWGFHYFHLLLLLLCSPIIWKFFHSFVVWIHLLLSFSLYIKFTHTRTSNLIWIITLNAFFCSFHATGANAIVFWHHHHHHRSLDHCYFDVLPVLKNTVIIIITV